MAEVLARYPTRILGEDGIEYTAQACGAQAPDGLWHGWLEFIATDGTSLRSGRETTQPNLTDAQYWATGLSPVYLEGALRRAMNPRVARPTERPPQPVYDRPAPNVAPPPAAGSSESILDPFSVYEKGETLLRKQLGALSSWHLANIIRAHDLGDGSDPDTLPPSKQIEQIVEGVKRRQSTARR